MELNEKEIDLATTIINIGLKKASDSMAFFTQEKMHLKSLKLAVKELNSIEQFTEKNPDESVVILTTELIGELPGVCFLIFTESECEKIFNVSLSADIRNNPEKLKLMGEAILLEMDNIISASVITQFSNILSVKVYGGVPQLTKGKAADISTIIKQNKKCPPFVLYFKSHFDTQKLNIHPEFIWLLDERFIEGVQSIGKNNSEIEKIKALVA